ncbi:MAG TPA: CBS domain-containing protein, partial [Caulobacteraceae bacterium]
VAESVSLSEAIVEMTRKRYGGVAVVDGGGALVGVFTDGDLRRALPTADLAAPMAGHMTRSPVTVDPRLLATEALRLMTERPRPIQLLIACEDGRPVGVVGMHDFLKAGIA